MTARSEPSDAVAQRLRLVADMWKRRMVRARDVDFSPAAIIGRLRAAAQLRRLCLELAAGGRRQQA